MTSVTPKLSTDDVSLLMVLLDTNPFFWSSANATSLSFSKFLSHVIAFLNSVLLLNQLNQVVVIATGINTCDYVYDSATAGVVPNQRAEILLQTLVEFVVKDEQLGKEDLVDGVGSSLLSGSLSMALCYIQRVFRSGPLHPQPRSNLMKLLIWWQILCLHGSPDGPEQYVAIMNAIFSAQRSMVPIDSCLLGAQHSAFLQQASYITGGVYLKPQQLDGLFQYLSTVFASDLYSRNFLQLPKPVGVDFRASISKFTYLRYGFGLFYMDATFKITMDVPSELTALSNMPVLHEKLNGQIKTVYFEESPSMSTYLVAVVVGLFDYIEDSTADGIKVRAYCAVGETDKGRFALSVAVKSLDLFKKYFSMPYPLPKLDMVAVPDFAGGAMENYGLIVYRETDMLLDDIHSAAVNKQRLVIVTTHEVAHQWFGNLVTMEWWTYLWLNEAFATWVSYLATDSLFPEWEIWTQFLDETAEGLRMDSLESSHPIEVEVHHARSILEVFDAISYEKGSAIIRMLMDYLGDDVFQKSLSSYMKNYACKNTKTEDLWGVLSEESGVQVNALMDTWTKKKGYPVISVKYEDCNLEFEQSQFVYSNMHSDDCWIVPISLSLGSCNKSKNFLLETKHCKLDISGLCQSSDGNSSSFEKNQEKLSENFWVKLNIGQTGFYRVKYDHKLTAQLKKAIEDNCLSASDRFGILDDMYALCEACQVSLSSLLSLMKAYRKEFDYTVLSRLIDICSRVAKISSDALPNLVNDVEQFFIGLLLFSAEKVGWEPIQGENHMGAMMRERVLMGLVNLGHSRTIDEAMKRFQAYVSDRNTPLLPVDCRRAVFRAVMRNTNTSNRNGFESLLTIYKEAQSVQEKARVLRCLASCPEPDIVLEVLNFTLSDEVRGQDVIYVLLGISLEGRETAWTWLKENWDLIIAKCGDDMLLHYFIRNIVTPFSSHEKADEVEAFFATRETASFAMNLKQSIEQVRIKARWVESIKQEESLEELVRGLACIG